MRWCSGLTASNAFARSETEASEMWSVASPRRLWIKSLPLFRVTSVSGLYFGARRDRFDVPKSSSDERRSRAVRSLNYTGVSNVAENFGVTQAPERKFDPVRMSGEL